jgi:hypothetical protein
MMIRQLSVVLVGALFVGCAHQRHTQSPYVFRDGEVVDWRKSAIAAASSPEQWKRGLRITQGPLRLDSQMLEYRLDGPMRDSVVVTMPCWGQGEHEATYLEIKLDRATGLIMSMREERER